ncbi:MAG: hypothetical protein M3O34_18835 [Chloroflexota bacterium]|nr:hypothetical protein [Chloroflexota bacterium]
MLTIGTREGGWAAVIGAAALWAMYALMTLGTTGVVPPLRVLEDQHWLFHILETPIMAVLTVGILALYRAQRRAFGTLGKAGGYFSLFGYGYGAVGSVIIVAAELIAGVDTATGLLDFLAHVPGFFPQTIGSLLFGIAALRAGVLPRAAAWPLAVGGGLQLLVSFSPAPQPLRLLVLLVLCLGWALLGYALTTGARARAGQPAPATA